MIVASSSSSILLLMTMMATKVLLMLMVLRRIAVLSVRRRRIVHRSTEVSEYIKIGSKHTRDGLDFHSNFLYHDMTRLNAVTLDESCSVCRKEGIHHIEVWCQHKVSEVDSASYSLDFHNCRALRGSHPSSLDRLRQPLKDEMAFWPFARLARLQAPLS